MSNEPKATTKHYTYPEPEAEYHEIIQNPDFFSQKLESFHAFYGTKFRIPTLGGNRLDLHQLFLEVTSRGGIEKVIRDRTWKEVFGAFNFPSTITSGSFVLRKYYMSLLYHFEQVYYFRKKEPSKSMAEQASSISNGSTSQHGVDDGAVTNLVSHNLEEGTLVTGTIDGKFDNGYLVTVNLGSEDLKGVLYHAPVEANVSQSFKANVSQSFTAPSRTEHQARKMQQVSFKDPSHPKRNRSGYTFFYAEHYPRLRPFYKGQERAIRSKAISTKIGQLWSRLSEDEKQVYQDKGKRDKERYQAEMLAYNSSHAQGH